MTQKLRAATARALADCEKRKIVEAVRRACRQALAALPRLPSRDEPIMLQNFDQLMEVLKVRDRILGRVLDVSLGQEQQKAIKCRERRERIRREATKVAEKTGRLSDNVYWHMINQLSDFIRD
jgi:hypothetical protein